MRSLEELRQLSPEFVERFLKGIDSSPQLVCIDTNGSVATTADDLWVTFQLSNLLLDLLAAARTGKGE